jgi:hypothetical protein
MAELNDDLFNGGLDSKMSFLNESKGNTGNDGLYRVDLSKVKDKKKGWRSVVRFLPNLTQEGKVGESAIEKISHFVNIKTNKELSGFFDSPKSFDKKEKCPLSDLFYTLSQSKNAILVEKAKCLNYSKKYYSYVLVLEDEQQPELVGKIMIYQYGKTIKDKILAEKNGEITGESVNVFSLENGKDFVIIAKEIQTGDETYPDYKMSMFKPEKSSLPIYNKEKGVFKNVPLGDNGRIVPEVQPKVKSFLLDREFELESFGPKRHDEATEAKINEIIAFLTGKTSTSFANAKANKPAAEDFEFEDDFTETKSTPAKAQSEDDFFDDL